MTKLTKAQRNYIYLNYEKKSIEDLAKDMDIKPGEVKEIVQAITQAKAKTPQSKRQSMDLVQAENLSPFVRLIQKSPVAIFVLILLTILAFTKSFSVPQHFPDREVYAAIEEQGVRKIMGEMLAPIKGLYDNEAKAHLFDKSPVRLLYVIDGKISEKLGIPIDKISHITNIIIHLAVGLFLFLLVRLTVVLMWPNTSLRYRDWIAPSVALFFLVFPSNADTITYLSGRFYSVPTLLFMAALFCYAMSRLSLKYFGFYFGFLLVLIYFGILTTECFVLFPFVALAYDLVCIREQESELRLLAGLECATTNSFKVIFYSSLVMCGAAFIMYLKWRNLDPDIKMYSLYTDAWLYPVNIIIGIVGGTAICYLFFLLEKSIYSNEPGLFVVLGSLTVIIMLCFVTNRENSLWNSPKKLWMSVLYNNPSDEKTLVESYNQNELKREQNDRLEPYSVSWGKALFFLGKAYDDLATKAQSEADLGQMKSAQNNACVCYFLAKQAKYTASPADLKILYSTLKAEIEWGLRDNRYDEVNMMVTAAQESIKVEGLADPPFANDYWLQTKKLDNNLYNLAKKKPASQKESEDKKKEVRELFAEIRDLAKAHPDELEQQLLVGWACLRFMRDDPTFMEECGKVVDYLQKKWPKNLDAIKFMARFYALRQEFSKTTQMYADLRKGKTKKQRAYLFLQEGEAFQWAQNNGYVSGRTVVDAMIQAFDSANKCVPDNPDIMRELAAAYFGAGATTRVESLLVQAQKERENKKLPADPVIDFMLGQLAEKMSNKEQAVVHYDNCWKNWVEQRDLYIRNLQLASSVVRAAKIAKSLNHDTKAIQKRLEEYLSSGPSEDWAAFYEVRKELKEMGASMDEVDRILSTRHRIDVSKFKEEDKKEEEKKAAEKKAAEKASEPQ